MRYAADHGAQVINLIVRVRHVDRRAATQIPLIASAVKYARSKGALIVAAAGNTRATAASRIRRRCPACVAVGAVTEHGCLADYSDTGPGLDLVAPGGGNDATLPGDPACQPAPPGRPIFQLTFTTAKRTLRLPDRLLRHLDGRAARVGDGGADHRVRGPWHAPDAERRSKHA